MSDSIYLHTQQIQQLTEQFLYEGEPNPYTDIGEWIDVQNMLSKGIEKLMMQEGSTPEEEAEAVLAILMGYTIAIRNSENIERTLERAKQVWPLVCHPLLKCKLAIFCYGECYDERLAKEAHLLIEEMKRSGHPEEMKLLENLLASMEENREIME